MSHWAARKGNVSHATVDGRQVESTQIAAMDGHDRQHAKLSAIPNGRRSLLWATDDLGRVFCLDACGGIVFAPLPAKWRALQIVVSASGRVWVTARCAEQQTYAVWSLSSDLYEWSCWAKSHAPYQIAGASADGCWMLQKRRLELAADQQNQPSWMPFDATQISEGLDGTLWAIDGKSRYGGFAVWRRSKGSDAWFMLPPPASAIRISGAPDGTAWSANSRGDIWRFHPNGAGNFRECNAVANCRNCLYSPQQSSVKDLSIGPDGVLWFLSTSTAPNGHSIGWMSNFLLKDSRYPAPSKGAVSLAASMVRAADTASI
ncbi:hypothetical protein PMI42_03099 [Bradyrhizobium sp. YR681]|uniref:hypothetical protein n=1 Tax=Bradyrhizobium sp. YR681 TaxID=1144344 RepID=UPI0002711BB0|nr:hypothetical protein [Bradyrhizobium sp. YR681]EJN13526.1 hypothetical protein PMI42_03099 [Bradyrhizobium sp. YR681]